MTGFQALAEGDPRQVGRYRVLARLGAGGMGQVFLGRSPGGRQVAIKVVRAELADEPQFRQRFAREVAAARRVNSFFTAGVVDADPDGPEPWLATAYVAGMSLGEAVTAHGPWAERPVRALGAALVEALEAIHAAGMVHRDLKPSNVLLAPDGPRVIDFGISLAVEETGLTQTGSVVGTPGFMSPEQLTAAPVGPPSDVFALGAVLAYAGTGSGPFGTGSAHGVNFRAVYEAPELDGLAPGLRELVARCLEKDPARRPTVAELLDLLAERSDATADWLPAPVAAAVRARSEAALPATPPPPQAAPQHAPSAHPPQNAPHTPPQPQAAPAAAPHPPAHPPAQPPAYPSTPPTANPHAWGPAGHPVYGMSPAGQPAPPFAKPQQNPSRRALLASVGGMAALAAGLIIWRLESDDDPADETTGSDGGTTEGDTGGNGTEGGSGGDDGGDTDGPRIVRIAFHGPLTGTLTEFGTELLDAARLAVNEAEEIPGIRVEILEADDGGEPDRALLVAEQTVSDQHVIAVVGPVLNSATEIAGGFYSQEGVPTVSPTATTTDFTERGWETFLRAVPNDEDLGTALGRFLRDQGVETVVLIDDTTPYGMEVADAAEDNLNHGSVEVTRKTYQEDVTDIDSLVQAVIDAGADGMAFCGYYPGAGPLAAGLAREGWSGIRVGTDPLMVQPFLDEAGSGGEGWFLVSTGFDPSTTSAGRDFAQRFHEVTDRDPDIFTTRVYDVTMMIIQAIAEVGPEVSRADVYEQLLGGLYEGLSDSISFAGDGEYTGATGPQLFRLTDGSFEPLGPVAEYRMR